MSLRLKSWTSVVVAYQSCTRKYAQMLEQFGLTPAQFDVLLAIEALGEDATPKSIARRLLVTKGNITGVMGRLESSKLIRRRPHQQDGRSQVCELTSTGYDRLQIARRGAALFIDAQLAPFSDESVARIHDDMSRMTKHLDSLDPLAIAASAREHA